MTPEKQLPLSIQTFKDLIQENRVYVDKTSYIHQLVSSGLRACFLSRPRRFGKSLTVTTLESIFLGHKDLFKGLAISKTEYAWPVHPVIRLDMKDMTYPSCEDIKSEAKQRLQTVAKAYGVTLTDNRPPEGNFEELITQLHQKSGQKVVVLIDEYDKPLINQLEKHNTQQAMDIQSFLKSFYGVLKSADEHLRFVFITGVSKFTKVSVFSDLNHLNDLTMDERYAALCGYTQEELETSFTPWINQLAQKEQLTMPALLDKIKLWYNGYRLTKAPVYVYNPWSTLFLFDKQSFENYWFETGTPTFLTQIMKKNTFDMSILQNSVSATDFSTYDIEQLQVIPLLFQTGFLTIKGYENEFQQYLLDFPNKEVADSFSKLFVEELTECEAPRISQIQLALRKSLQQNDLQQFFDIINSIFASIPSHLHQKKEAYYHSIFIAACQMASVPVMAEESSSLGRSDAILRSPTAIYVVEFKLNDSVDVALKQIEDKGYLDKYRYVGLPVFAVGVSFDSAQRKIVDVRVVGQHN